MADLDFQGLGRELLGRARDLLPSWLPGGRMVSKEYTVANLQGGPGDSLKINVDNGRWADFATGATGGDLISLYAAIQGIGQGDAFKRLSSDHGFATHALSPVAQPALPPISLCPPPPDAQEPEFGPCSGSWAYRGASGELLFHVVRYDPPGERKVICPFSWDGRRWVRKSWASPRPLYGLDLLASRPGAPVMLVEGEKSAESARRIAGDVYVVATWPNGSQNVKHVDWAPLRGRQILIWPDADGPGLKAANWIAEHLAPAEVKVIDTEGQPDGWDAANAEEEGWDFARLVAWAKPRAHVWKPPATGELLAPPPKDGQTGREQDPGPVEPKLYASWQELGITLTRQNTPICNLANALLVMQNWKPLRELVWLDVFHRKLFTKWDAGTDPGTPGHTREWEAVDELRLLDYFQTVLGLRRMALDQIRQAVLVRASAVRRNEPRDWLHQVTPTWDKKPRIGAFFQTYFGVKPGEYEFAASKNWWIQLAGRMDQPGCQSDTMPIIKGPTGLGKSKAFQIIGGSWFAVCETDVTSPKFHEIIQGKLIIEIAELDSFSKSDITTVKNILTARTDRLRMPYEKYAQDYPRQCVFVGTTEEEEFLKDNASERERRFWPMVATAIDLQALARDREQLFAEAGTLLFQGESWHEMPIEAMIEAQQSFKVSDEWDELVVNYVTGRNLDEVNILDMAKDVFGFQPERVDMKLKFRLGSILRRLGFRKIVKKISGHSVKAWIRVSTALSTDEPPPF